MVSFSIKTKTGLPYGTLIPNGAGVYFDANAVVMTNTVTNIIGTPAAVKNEPLTANDVTIYPNPANNLVNIKTTNGAYSSASIINTLGQLLLEQTLQATDTSIDIQSLAPGIYYILLKGATGLKAEKMQKL